MELKIKYSIANIVNELLSLVLAASIVILSTSIVFIACFQSEGFVKKNFEAYSPKAIQCVNNKLEEIAENTGFPVEAYTNCYNEEISNVVFEKIISNIYFGYSTDFSDDSEIYHFFKTNLTNYCYDNSIDVSSKSISDNSSLAVDAINEVMGGISTSKISIMHFTKSNMMIAMVIVPFFLIVASMIAIDLINKGRHRRLNYYGMGVTISGAVLSAVSVFVLVNKYAVKYQFCENAIYDSAVGDITNFALKICATIGIIYLVVGFIILFNNLHYYSDKMKKQKEFREHKKQLKSDYMLEYEGIKNQSEDNEIENATIE